VNYIGNATDPCTTSANPCTNGGRCTFVSSGSNQGSLGSSSPSASTGGTFHCSCLSGFLGPTCGLAIFQPCPTCTTCFTCLNHTIRLIGVGLDGITHLTVGGNEVHLEL